MAGRESSSSPSSHFRRDGSCERNRECLPRGRELWTAPCSICCSTFRLLFTVPSRVLSADVLRRRRWNCSVECWVLGLGNSEYRHLLQPLSNSVMEGSVSKSLSVRNPERSRAVRPKVKVEPRSTQELIQDLALFREQTVEFFVKVRGLGNSGMNPKSAADTAGVSADDLEEVWGKVSSYRTTNTRLHPETRRELINLYAKIYGTEDVTNNEFMLWVVKGFILECKGEVVDWATAAASTAREKADRCQRELEKSRISDSAMSSACNSLSAVGVSGASQPLYSFAPKSGKPNGKRSTSSKSAILSSSLGRDQYLGLPASQLDLAAVEDVLKLEIQLLETANRKVLHLAEARKKNADRIIGLRYNMDDRKGAARESEDAVKVLESSVKSMDAQISRTAQTVSYFTQVLQSAVHVVFRVHFSTCNSSLFQHSLRRWYRADLGEFCLFYALQVVKG